MTSMTNTMHTRLYATGFMTLALLLLSASPALADGKMETARRLIGPIQNDFNTLQNLLAKKNVFDAKPVATELHKKTLQLQEELYLIRGDLDKLNLQAWKAAWLDSSSGVEKSFDIYNVSVGQIEAGLGRLDTSALESDAKERFRSFMEAFNKFYEAFQTWGKNLRALCDSCQ